MPKPVRAAANQCRPPRNIQGQYLFPFDVRTIHLVGCGEEGRAAANPACTLISSCITGVPVEPLRAASSCHFAAAIVTKLKMRQFVTEWQTKKTTKQKQPLLYIAAWYVQRFQNSNLCDPAAAQGYCHLALGGSFYAGIYQRHRIQMGGHMGSVEPGLAPFTHWLAERGVGFKLA